MTRKLIAKKKSKLKVVGKAVVPEVVDGGTYSDLVGAIGELLEHARERIATTANTTLVETYWNTGRYIVEYEQHGADRAKYGDALISRLARDLTVRHGRGFSKTNILYMRKLYLTFRKGETLSHFLSWSHYMLILKAADGLEIEFYCRECERSHWSVRELRRQLNSMLFHRLALSKDKKGVLELARKGNDIQRPQDIMRDHYVLEFSGIKQGAIYKESTLHAALVEHMKNFMLELGKGFAFVESQKHMRTECNDYFIDLVFYNFMLKCFFLIDLKVGRITHQDVGQMDMYVRMYDEIVKQPDDNPTIGIVLCADTDPDIARYSILKGNEQIFATKYQLNIPTPEELTEEVAKQRATLLIQLAEQEGGDAK